MKMNATEKLAEVAHALEIISFEEEQIKYTTKVCRINTPIKLNKWKDKNIKDAAGDGENFNMSEASSIIDFKRFYQQYLLKGGNNLQNDFAEEVWEAFEPGDNQQCNNHTTTRPND